ncbi:MAG TPA: SGNH/GDSL hydrolase family protein [Verrucomicrobiae bacterium]
MITPMDRRRFLLTSGLALLATQLDVSAVEKPPLGAKIKRVLFLGDSITYSGQYVDYVEAAWRTRFPESQVDFLDLGLPSETVSGLSEPGHAGGKFPRPDLHERLDRVLAQVKPDLVIACYGMNDGIYHPFSEERMAAHQKGILKLREKVQAAGAKIIHLTPPVFDPQPIKAKTLPAGRDVYEQPYVGYDEVLTKFSEWLLSMRKSGWEVYDIHGPMLKHLETRRKTTPEFTFAKDGVHADATGHWLMAQALLQGWKLKPDVEIFSIDASSARTLGGNASAVNAGSAVLVFQETVHPAQPYDTKWNTESMVLERFAERTATRELRVLGLSTGQYHLKEDDKIITTASAKELAKGVALDRLVNTSLQKNQAELLKLISQRRKLLSDAWLTATGHQRPGMAKGLPLAEAESKAMELGVQIMKLTRPITMKLTLVAEVAK